MRNLTIYCFFIVLLLSSSCKKDMVLDPSTLMGKLDTLWTSPINQDTSSSSTYNLLEHENTIILNILNSRGKDRIIAFDKKNGNRKWEWDELEVSSYPSSFIMPDRNLCIVQNRGNIASIDMATGKTYKIYQESEYYTSNPYGQLLGEYYYFSLRSNDDKEAWIVRSHIDDFQNWETIYSITENETGGSRPNPQSYNLWIDPDSGDEILIFQHRMALPARIDIEAWNITQQKTEWKYEDIAKLNNSNHQQILLLDDKAFFMAGITLYCIEIKSGEILWEYDHPSGINGFMLHQLAYCKDLNLFIHKDGSSLLAFDPEKGFQYRNMSAGDSDITAGSPICYDGVVYYTADTKLYAHQAVDGTLLWEEESTLNLQSHFNSEIAIDENEGALYVGDRYYLLAIKTYEE